MEPALILALEQRSDSAPSTTGSVRKALQVLSTSRHQSPAKKPKRATRGRSPTSRKGKERAGEEPRPLLDGSTPLSGSRAPAHVEQSSPFLTIPATVDGDEGLCQFEVPSMPEALQAAQEILTLLVPPTPALAVPKPRSKSALGPFRVPASTAPLPIAGDIPPVLASMEPSCLGLWEAGSEKPCSGPWAPTAGFEALVTWHRPAEACPPGMSIETDPLGLQHLGTSPATDRWNGVTGPTPDGTRRRDANPLNWEDSINDRPTPTPSPTLDPSTCQTV
ncbi:hypothetical protein UY3_06381 [Chelonia mydas]|uniref:Uncharacterized protein n=1 Tax=Chelonia mydas TaxID=8469 RepID=M7BGS0_CHEMY|nr:hypothetical protein UY3_06381 [Chelonia mydas]